MTKKWLVAVALTVVSLNIVVFAVLNRGHQDPPPHRQPVAVSPYTVIPYEGPETQTWPVEPQRIVPTFVEVEKFRNVEGDSVYADVLSHSKEGAFGNAHGRATNVHETAHGIHSYLRNKYRREMGKKVNGFYVLEGRGVIIEEPNMRKSRIKEFLPQNLRSYRYSTYISGQQAWDDTPLYIYDEWAAYVLGGMTNIDDVQNGRYKGGWTDGVSGCLGFSIYAVATCMAVKKYDPDYWRENDQFRNFTIWMLQRAEKTFKLGREMEQFKWDKQDKLYNELLTSEAAAPMRAFIQDNLGGVWLEDSVPVSLREIEYNDEQKADLTAASALRELQLKAKP
jgi:hypothetical protein